ncbi:MAG: F0F1 ATP synthase subunit alpha [Candidatus Levybacteria bacterium]|nr:F0F1 ATP synthase subunit alpha [Candidatus Levybacteria bacterium]
MKDFTAYLNQIQEIGYVEEVTDAIIHVSGLPEAKSDEIVYFETGDFGQVFTIHPDLVEILVFSKNSIKPGTRVVRTNSVLQIPVGFELLGRVIDPLGNSIDSIKPLKKMEFSRSIQSIPLGIAYRKTIITPFETGVSMVDMVMPLGHGQRELIIGDRKTGKTNFLMKTVLSQAKKGNVCVYASIGKKKIDIKQLEEFFIKNKIMDKAVIVASGSEDATGLIYLTPFTAMTICEYFRDQGKNVVVILDDLSTHAKFYREIALLGKRFPGRNSYPSDMFFIHAQLMERAGNFITQKGEFSITCFPVAETMQGDLSGYIETNLMSMTDGHLYFDRDLFYQGRRPAINPFLSVTRVGRQTQTNLRREINREIISFFTLYEKMQSFIHFGTELNENIKATLATGEKLIRFFNQKYQEILPIDLQLIFFVMLWGNVFEGKDFDAIENIFGKIFGAYEEDPKMKQQIDNLIKIDSFNKLLASVRKQTPDILKLSEKYGK